jgi:hypothetical protein
VGWARKLERLGLAELIGQVQWRLRLGLEPALRDLGVNGDIMKAMHLGREPDVSGFPLHGEQSATPGPLVERGLHDELDRHGLRDC